MVHSNISKLLVLAMLIVLNQNTHKLAGQESLEMLREYPPTILAKDSVKNALASIKWKLKQKAAMQDTYRMSRDKISAELEATESAIHEVNQTLPPNIRFLNDDGRSALANLAMGQLLEARLELVSLESLIKQMQKNLAADQDTTNEVQKMEAEMQSRAAMSRLELAKYEHDQNQKLKQQGSISDQTYQRSRMNLEVAEAEFAIAAKKAQMVSRAASVEVANRLSEIRVEVEPLQAKIKSLEEFLGTLHKAADSVSKIKQLQRQRELLQKDLAMVANALFESAQQATELRTFQALVEGEQKAGDKEKN